MAKASAAPLHIACCKVNTLERMMQEKDAIAIYHRATDRGIFPHRPFFTQASCGRFEQTHSLLIITGGNQNSVLDDGQRGNVATEIGLPRRCGNGATRVALVRYA